MQIINKTELMRLSKKHPAARGSASNWMKIVASAEWKNFSDVVATFRETSFVKGYAVFNLGGNKYRVVASIDYDSQKIYLVEALDHQSYDRWRV